MFISSLTLTAVVLACVSFFTVRAFSAASEDEIVVSHSGNSHHPHPTNKIKNFIATDALSDGEQETRVHFRGVTAKETSVNTGSVNDTAESQFIKLRQLTDGVHFIQLIYGADGELKDCEYIRQKKMVQSFLNKFRKDIERAKGTAAVPLNQTYSSFNNVTFRVVEDGDSLPEDVSSWLNYDSLKQQCKENHKELKKLARLQQHGTEKEKEDARDHLERWKRSLMDNLIAPGTQWCGPHQVAKSYGDLGAFSRTDRCCMHHDSCHMNIPAFTTKYDYFNLRPFTLSHCKCDRRKKRELMDVLRIPGTEWCGKGQSAYTYTHMGGFEGADKCCRIHDTACPFYISAFEEKYGIFNWRVSTIMHCSCDDRFRSCLKLAHSGAANMVGKLFFNVVQTKCFVLKPEKVCAKRSWWGKCVKYAYKKQAHLRNNPPY